MKKIAVINAGSSSLKYKLFSMPEAVELDARSCENVDNYHDAFSSLNIPYAEIDAIGHRVVHGAERFIAPTVIDDAVLQELHAISFLAPLHNPVNIEGIEIAKKLAPNIPHIAVFDTAFHQTMPPEAYLYAIDLELYTQEKIRRYGFHGSSYSYLLKEAAKIIKKPTERLNLIALHLGNGASACAIKNGKSIDTSMGFTPLEGLIMGTRCGDIDGGIVLYLQKKLSLRVDEVETLLNKKSGLYGLCGSNDVREILVQDTSVSKLALDMMIRRIQKYIGSYMVLLEGDIDAIVFSGGIGEHANIIRQRVMDNKMFQSLNMLVIPTNEELAIADGCYRMIT